MKLCSSDNYYITAKRMQKFKNNTTFIYHQKEFFEIRLLTVVYLPYLPVTCSSFTTFCGADQIADSSPRM